ncbi:MAG TPA: NDP-sugar synthase [Actinomycetota bacterium]|nr:NDP-sugar synthase [Actinomycetota bacterium]
MKALLLTGGFGTRLRPLTFTRPKHLLPIGNRPHMERVFDLLAAHGVDDVVLTTSYLAEAFAATVAAARARGVQLEVTHEPEPLGTAGAIKNAEAHLADAAFLVFNGDILTDADLGAMVAFHRDRDAEATILLTPVPDPSAYGVVPTDANGRVTGFIEKPPRDEAPTNLINAGVYLFEPSVLARVPPNEPWSAETQLFPGLVAEGAALYALGSTAYWMDIGTPQKYLQANLDFLSGRYGGREPRSVLADADAVVDTGARVSSACLGRGARVEDGAVVTDSVLLPDARVGSGATLVRSILGEGARVGKGAHVEGATVADGDEVTRA